MLSCCQLCSVTRQVSEQSQESCIRMIEWKEFDFHRWLVLLVAGKVQEDGRAGTRTTSEVGDCVWSCVCGPVMCHWLCVVLWCLSDCVWSCDVSLIVCGPVMCRWLCVVLWCVIDCVWSCDVSLIVCGPVMSQWLCVVLQNLEWPTACGQTISFTGQL